MKLTEAADNERAAWMRLEGEPERPAIEQHVTQYRALQETLKEQRQRALDSVQLEAEVDAEREIEL